MNVTFSRSRDDLGNRIDPIDPFGKCEPLSHRSQHVLVYRRIHQEPQRFAAPEQLAAAQFLQCLAEVFDPRIGAQQKVSQQNQRRVLLECLIEGPFVGEGVGVEKIQKVEQIPVAQMYGRGRKHHEVAGHAPEELTQLRRLGLGVAHVVRLVDDDKIKRRLAPGAFVGQHADARGERGLVVIVGLLRKGTQTLHARDDGEFGTAVACGLCQPVDGFIGRTDQGVDAESIGQFLAPFFPKHGRTQDQQAPCVLAASQLGPDQACFDRLPKADLVGNQDSPGRRIQEGKNGLELVGVEVGIGGVEAVDQVGQLAPEARVGQRGPQFAGIDEPELLHVIEGVATGFRNGLERQRRNRLRAIGKDHLPSGHRRAARRISREDSRTAGI